MSFGQRSSTNTESETRAPALPLSDTALFAGILILTALVFLPTLRFEFVYDDQGQIVENTLVHSWRFVPEYFQGQVWQHLFPNAPANYYRPLNILWFRINHAMFGLQPFGWHASAILMHLLATALVFFIVRRITSLSLLAAVAALFFGIHPTRHEVVAWVSGTTESFCAVLFLSAFLAYLLSRERWTTGWISVSCFLYASAILAKETAIVLPLLIFSHAWLYGVNQREAATLSPWSRFSRAAVRASVFAPVIILYAVVRMQILHGFSHAQTPASLTDMLLTLPSVLIFYLKQWLLPVRLSEFYDLPLRNRWDWLPVMLPLALLAAFAGTLWYFRRKLGARELAFASVALLAPLLPALHFSLFAQGELVHDRYFYLPGLGAALLAALALQPLFAGPLVFRLPQRMLFVLLPLLTALSYSTANASSYWVNDFVLFRHAYELAPENVTARNNYAVQLARRGGHGTAIPMLEKLVRDRPDYYLGSYNLGRLLYEMNLMGAAEHYFEQARKLDPGMPDAHLQLGMLSIRTGRAAQAESHFRSALALRPRDPKYHFVLGVTLAQLGNCSQSRAEFAQTLALQPGFPKAQEQMDNCHPENTAKDLSLGAELGPAAKPAVTPRLAPAQGP